MLLINHTQLNMISEISMMEYFFAYSVHVVNCISCEPHTTPLLSVQLDESSGGIFGITKAAKFGHLLI